MGFDFKSLLAQFVAAMTAFVASSLPTVIETANSYVAATQDRLSKLSEYYISGDISKKFLLDKLEDEKNIMISQLLSFGIIGGQLVEDAVNKAMEIVTAALNQATTGENR